MGRNENLLACTQSGNTSAHCLIDCCHWLHLTALPPTFTGDGQRACCRPTETGAGPSEARIAAAASHFTGVFLACAWCRENSRILENPHSRCRDRCCARHRHALRTRVCAPQVRAQCLLACLASSCSAISATAVQPSSAAHCGIGRRKTLRACTQIAYTSAHCLLDFCHWLHLTALPPPDSSTAAPRVAKNKNSEVARRHPDGLRLHFLHRVRHCGTRGRGVCACVILVVYAKVRGARHDLVLTWWCFSTYRNLATRGRSGIHGLDNSADIEFCDHHEGSPFK